ncbi:MAG: 5-formyltetrahydrofolate cyclo-ligase [Wujia sp.]
MEDKKDLRKRILLQRNKLLETEIKTNSSVICEKLKNHPFFKESENICLYMPIRNEVDVMFLRDTIFWQEKKLWLPKIIDGSMDFYRYMIDTELRVGPYGIKEPDTDLVLNPQEDTLIVMPGAVFSRNCDRIGYGGGYYDKYLSRFPMCRTIAVAYSFQIVDEFEAEAHDIRPEIIITELEEITRC